MWSVYINIYVVSPDTTSSIVGFAIRTIMMAILDLPPLHRRRRRPLRPRPHILLLLLFRLLPLLHIRSGSIITPPVDFSAFWASSVFVSYFSSPFVSYFSILFFSFACLFTYIWLDRTLSNCALGAGDRSYYPTGCQ